MKTRHTFAAICGLGLLAGGLTGCATRTRSAHSDRVQLPVRLPLYFTPNPAAPGSFSVNGAGASAVFAAERGTFRSRERHGGVDAIGLGRTRFHRRISGMRRRKDQGGPTRP